MSYQFKTKAPNPYFSDVSDVSPQEVFDHAAQLRLIDVRETSEYTDELGHAAQSELIVLGTLPDKLKSISQDKPIVFICRSGGRSAKAAAYAQQQGFTEVYNMQGGMMLWNQMALPVERS